MTHETHFAFLGSLENSLDCITPRKPCVKKKEGVYVVLIFKSPKSFDDDVLISIKSSPKRGGTQA